MQEILKCSIDANGLKQMKIKNYDENKPHSKNKKNP